MSICILMTKKLFYRINIYCWTQSLSLSICLNQCFLINYTVSGIPVDIPLVPIFGFLNNTFPVLHCYQVIFFFYYYYYACNVCLGLKFLHRLKLLPWEPSAPSNSIWESLTLIFESSDQNSANSFARLWTYGSMLTWVNLFFNITFLVNVLNPMLFN